MKLEENEHTNLRAHSPATRLEKWLPLTTILLAPYFYLRPYGFDFTRGTSFSLVDACLVLLLVNLILEERIAIFQSIVRNIYATLGIAFVVTAAVAALIGRYLGDFESPLKLWNLFSGLAQYGFVFIALPLLAMRYFSNNIHRLIRWISIAYLPPMLIGMVFLNHATPEILRGLFYFANRAIGTYGNANGYAVVILLVFPYYTYLAATDTGRWRLIGFLGQTASLLSLLLTVSFSGALVLAGMVSIGVCSLFLNVRRKQLSWLKLARFVAMSFILAIAAGYLVYLYAPTVITDISPRLSAAAIATSGVIENKNVLASRSASSSAGNNSGVGTDRNASSNSSSVGSASQRVDLMHRAVTAITDHNGNIIWGAGLGNSRFSTLFTFDNVQLDVHNVYLLLWVESGLLSALLFLIILFAGMVLVRRSAPAQHAAALAIGLSILAMALVGLIHPHLYLRYFWIPLLPAFALAHHYRFRN